MATLTAPPSLKISGGGFLIEERTPEEVFTPEDFTDQHLLIAQTAEEFANKEIVPNIEKLEHKEFAVSRDLLRKAGELGLSGVDVPEQYGGLQLDKVTSAIIADRIVIRRVQHHRGAHTCIGTLPTFISEPKNSEKIPGWTGQRRNRGAYALSKSSSD
jgi:alkylation response protein AidB-like acyl-CoA dehydrogenase